MNVTKAIHSIGIRCSYDILYFELLFMNNLQRGKYLTTIILGLCYVMPRVKMCNIR